MRPRLVQMRDALDGYRHRDRLRRARAWLGELRPTSVLFICLGNICRSPYAGARMRALAPDGIAVDSAGFIGPGRAPPPEALEIARGRDLALEAHRSQLVTSSSIRRAGAIFVFDKYNVRALRRHRFDLRGRLCLLGDFDPEWTGKRSIGDPWGKPPEVFEHTFERIDRCLLEVARILSEARAATPGDSGTS